MTDKPMTIRLTPQQIRALRGSINRTLMDMGAECFEQNTYDNEPLSDYCREVSRETRVLERILHKINQP